ncbi:bifunctional glutamate N-acetyltransferase/amino-acid acetyltransferase ArgJ, partial [bacterium]|nr:bifunctional glutamate N-acetyltransferase/amino-acid acetyltransferase ArgJ [bacterium]
ARGMKDARNMRTRAGRLLSMDAELVYVSSAGIIGVPLPVQKISNALPALVDGLSPAGISAAAAAIMTTDTYPKIVTKKFRIGSGYATLSGIAKGAGMICPDMATMLCFIMTDAAITRPALLTALKRAVDKSFNRISVDNDMSTNDTVIAMANGHRGNVPLSTRSPYFNNFSRALDSLTDELSRMIVRDGEGATKLIEIVVEGAVSEVEAVKASRAVANSMLVKTAMYGKDPNWGRIIAAIGYSGASLREEKISIDLNGIRLVSRGIGTGKALEANKALSESEIVLKINLGAGRCSAGFITSDLTEEYIRVNAHYST